MQVHNAKCVNMEQCHAAVFFTIKYCSIFTFMLTWHLEHSCIFTADLALQLCRWVRTTWSSFANSKHYACWPMQGRGAGEKIAIFFSNIFSFLQPYPIFFQIPYKAFSPTIPQLFSKPPIKLFFNPKPYTLNPKKNKG